MILDLCPFKTLFLQPLTTGCMLNMSSLNKKNDILSFDLVLGLIHFSKLKVVKLGNN